MESSNMEIKLLFCKPCGLQRVCDVTKELQKLFTAKYLEPNTCGICQRHVELKNGTLIHFKKSGQSGEKGQNEGSDCENEDCGLCDDISDQNGDDVLPKIHFVGSKEKRGTKATSKRKSVKVGIQDRPVKAVNQEGTRWARLETGAITTRNSQEDEEESEFESNSEDTASGTASESLDEDDTDMQSDQDNDDIDEEVQDMMQMEEDPDLVVLSALSKDKENPTNFLDPELMKLTVPSEDPERPIRCKVCSATFITVGPFTNHVSDHTGKGPMEKPLKCSDCGQNYSVGKFKQHRSRHLKWKYPQQCTFKGCKFAFKDRTVFQNHLDVHKGVKRYCCKVCGAGYLRKKNMIIHAQGHPEYVEKRNRFPCRYCKKCFTGRLSAKKHERKAHERKENITCDECGLTCSTQYKMNKHKKSHKKGHNFVCTKCGDCFPDQDRLDEHAKSNTCKAPDDIDWEETTKFVNPRLVALMDKPRIRDKPFRCKQCPTKEFKVASLFLNHMKYKHPQIDCPVTHVYTCNQCDKKFKTLQKLTIHSVSHSLLRSHFCDYEGCNKTFKSLSQMKLHKTTHRSERNHICHICGAGLVSKSKLEHHVVAVHRKDQPRPYNCSYCSRGFLQKGAMDCHVKLRHLNMKPFVCEVCGKSFKENHLLVTHNYTHTGERPYACHMCEYRCIRSDYLKRHIRTHTGEQPHKCELCETTFMHKTNLNNHMKKVHYKSEPRHTLATFNDETVGRVVNNPLVTSHETVRAVLHIPSVSGDTAADRYSCL